MLNSAAYNQARSFTAHWCSWLTRCPLKAEITGSSPVCAANFPRGEQRQMARTRNTLLLIGLLGFLVLSFVGFHAVTPLMANAQSPDTKVRYAPITGAIKDGRGNTRIGISAQTKIDRRDYGITWGHTLAAGGFDVGNEVTIELNLEALKPAPKPASQ